MPSLNINLLPQEAFLEKEKEKHRQKSIFRFTFLVVMAATILILVAFGYSFYLKSQASSLQQKAEIERGKIEELRRREALLLWTKIKVLAIQQALSTRPLYAAQLKALDLITGLLPEGASLTDYLFNAQKVELTLLAPNSKSVEEFIDKLVEENDRQTLFKEATIKSFTLEKDGGYKFSITATLIK